MLRDLPLLRHTLAAWFAEHARPLPWRAAGVSPWGILVSEVMLQQTPAARVMGPWLSWMERWPTPAALDATPTADVLRAWGRLGYPRRALRLQEAAHAVVEHHDGVLPQDEEALLALPGVGSYTAAAVMAFAFGKRSLVLDVNVRRVLARLDAGAEHPARSETASERRRAWEFVPDDDADAALWSAAAMELGAVICTARNPACGDCPVSAHCAWLAAGKPEWDGPRRGTARTVSAAAASWPPCARPTPPSRSPTWCGRMRSNSAAACSPSSTTASRSPPTAEPSPFPDRV